MLRYAKSVIHRLGRAYNEHLAQAERRDQRFERINERPIEYRFVFEQLTECQPQTVLDVGTGTTALPHLMRHCGFLVTASDNRKDYWPRGMVNRHFHVLQDDITQTQIQERFDAITCISVLEHVKDFARAVESMSKLLNPGGHWIASFPYSQKGYIENCYALKGSSYGQDAPYVCQAFAQNQLEEWQKRWGLRLKKQEFWKLFSGDAWTVGRPMPKPLELPSSEGAQLTCVLFQK